MSRRAHRRHSRGRDESFATAVDTRLHQPQHARQAEYIDVNYAIHLPLVDMLMGTFKLPRDPAQWPQEYGVMKLETVPKGIVRQHLMPFQGGRKFDDYVD